MKREIELILLGCIANRTKEEQERLDVLFPQNLDWAFITGELVRHRLNGNFLTSLSKKQTKYIISKVWDAFYLLSLCYEAGNKKNLAFFEELIKKTDEAGIKVAGLKGVVFNTSIYNLNARKSNDLDVLVKEADLKKFDIIMRNLGFIQSLDGGITEATRREKMIQLVNYHDLVPYIKRINLPYQEVIEVDVNFRFDSKDDDITEAILEDGLHDYCGNGYTVRGLNIYTHLLHLCVHFYREASNSIWTYMAKDVDLYKLVDIENTIRSYSRESLSEWCTYVDKYKLRKQCYFTLHYLNIFYPCSLYCELMEKIKPNEIEYITKVQIGGGELKEREDNFFERAFDMHYGKDFDVRDVSKVY